MDVSEHWFLPPDPKGQFAFEVQAYLFNLLVAVKEARDDEVERLLKPLGLTRPHYRTLLTIRKLAPCAMNELSIMTAIDRTTLTRCLDQLVRMGLVERRSDEADRRLVILGVTDAGRAKATEAEAVVNALGVRALAPLSERDQRVMVASLQVLLRQFGTTAEDMDRIFAARDGGPAQEARP